MKLRNIILSFCFTIATTIFGQTFTETVTYNTADTLLTASNANNIAISSTPTTTQITIRKINNTPDNFFYRTGSKASNNASKYNTEVNYSDIQNIVVSETPQCVTVSFKDHNGDEYDYSFCFADPDNRSVKSYLGEKGSDFGFTISRGNTIKWDIISQGLAFGWTTTLDAPNMHTSMGRGRDLLWNMILGIRMTHKNHSLSAGFGIHHQTFATIGHHYYNKTDNGQIELDNFNSDQTKGESRLKFFSLQIPLIYKISFGRHNNWGFNLGPVLNFNTGGHIETKYTSNGSDYKINTGKISQRKVTVDAMAMFNFQEIGLYVRYSPMNRLQSHTGLNFESLSTGIMLIF